MKKDNIEILIQKYLNGETAPEEEKALALEVSREDAPLEWKIIAEMLGELTVDEALYDKMMAERNRKPRIIKLWPWVAVACVAALLMVFLTPPKEEVRQVAKIEDVRMEQSEPIILEDTKPVQEVLVAGGKIESTPVAKSKDIVVKRNITTNQVAKVENVEQELLLAEAASEPVKATEDTPYVKPDYSEPIDGNLHYASITTNDTLKNYQSPSRMEEFIMKMADYHRVKGERLPYSSSEDDSLTVSTAYVFNDTKELNLFSRLLQAACWYEDTTPGYLLNYSHQQFFFRLEDRHCKTQYLWIAERIRGKILLYSAHAPLDAEMSSDGFREYRNRLSNTSIKF